MNNNLNLRTRIEHTLLKNNISEQDISKHISQAQELNLLGVCIPLAFVPYAKKQIKKSNLKIITVIDFPLGQKSSTEKAQEAKFAQDFGADEIDMVLDYQALINKNYQKPLQDIILVLNNISDCLLKIIIETSALNHDQKVSAITLVGCSGAHFIKTSTGTHTHGAQEKDILLMRNLLPNNIKIKASGGIKTPEFAQKLVRAGADRIGASQSDLILLGNNTG